MAADAAEAGTDPGRRYIAGDREPTCPEDRAWLALLDDVAAIQRFRLNREPLAVTWTQTFTPAEKSAHTALSDDDENLFPAGVALIRQAQIRCDTNWNGNDHVLWRRHHDLQHDAGFPEWKWARYIDDTDILLGVPSPDYLWEKAAGFEDWLHEHPGKARWVPRVKAAFDRKERFNTRNGGSYRAGGWGRRAVAREPGFALIAALSILDENPDTNPSLSAPPTNGVSILNPTSSGPRQARSTTATMSNPQVSVFTSPESLLMCPEFPGARLFYFRH